MMLTVAYLGPQNTNTHRAALKRFGRRAKYLHAPTVDNIFYLVERRQATYGVVPIENSLEGAVTHTLDRFVEFVDTPVRIQGEIEQPINHYLIFHKRTHPANLKVVFSHPQALAQCHAWLEKTLHHVHLIETDSTAEAVQDLLGRKPVLKDAESGKFIYPVECAAIARPELVKNRKTLRAIPIPERRENKTRFLIIGLGKPQRTRKSKTSVLVALKDQPGALHDALVPFKHHRINLTKIESRPSKRKAWEYLFFIDFEGHVEEPRVKRALQALKRSTTLLRVLGSYPMRT